MCYYIHEEKRKTRKEVTKMLDDKKLYNLSLGPAGVSHFHLPKEYRLKRDTLPPNIC